MVSVKGRTRSHLNFECAPGFLGRASFKEVYKNALGMLNVLPPVVPVKKKSQHIVARKCKGTELGTASMRPRVKSHFLAMTFRRSCGSLGRWHVRPETRASVPVQKSAERENFRRGSSGDDGRERYVDVFKKGLGGDAEDAVGDFDEVVTRLAGVFAAKRVGKHERFGELTGAHEEAGAIDVPRIFLHS